MKYTNYFSALMTITLLLLSNANYVSAKDTTATHKLHNIKEQVSGIVWHTLVDDQSWAYILETSLDKGDSKKQQRIQKFNPALPSQAQWQLLEHQYKPPSEQMLFEYAQTRASLANEENMTAGSQIIDVSSLRFLSRSSSHEVYTFSPLLPMFDKEDARYFKGTLFVNKLNGQLDYLTISLADSFSPSFSVKLNRYDLKINLANENNVIHVSKIESHKTGRLVFVSEFNEKSTRLISDFSKVKG